MCYRLNVCVPHSSSHVDAVIPRVMIFMGRAFRGPLGHMDGDFINGIRALLKRDTRDMIALSTMTTFHKSEKGFSSDTNLASTYILDFSIFRTARNKCLLCKLPAYSNLSWQPRLTDTVCDG